MEAGEAELLAQANVQCQDPAFRDAVWRHLRYRGESASVTELSTRINLLLALVYLRVGRRGAR